MRQLLKSMNYAAQLMALIDIGKTIKRWSTKNKIAKQLSFSHLAIILVIPTGFKPVTF